MRRGWLLIDIDSVESLKKVLPVTKKLTEIMNKAEAATNNNAKKRSEKNMKTAESMLTDGLSQHTVS